MDAPLLNRFEKQFYKNFENINEIDEEIRLNLEQWLMSISDVENFSVDSMFPVLCSGISFNQYTLNSLVQLSKEVADENSRLDFCKESLI